jgi:hypothetical protein
MANNIAFHQIPATLRLPLFWAEVDPSMANSNTQPQRSLIIGQSLASGAINTAVATSAPSASGAVLTFAAVPAGVQPGQNVQDNTTPGAITLGTTVLSKTPQCLRSRAQRSIAARGARCAGYAVLAAADC